MFLKNHEGLDILLFTLVYIDLHTYALRISFFQLTRKEKYEKESNPNPNSVRSF
jgi:hypothetical protein